MTDDLYSIGDHHQDQVHYKTLNVQAGPKEASRAKLIWHVFSSLNFFLTFPKYLLSVNCISQSVQSLSHVQFFVTPWTAACQSPCPSPTPGVYPNSCPLSWWCHLTITSSVIPFSCLQSFPTSGFLKMSQLFASGGQNIGVSASISVLPVNTQDWFPLGWTGWISLQSKGLMFLVIYKLNWRK